MTTLHDDTAPGRSRSMKVLVVEDDEDTRANLADLLELDGYQADLIGSLRELTEFSRWSQISAVILDRRLPDGDAQTAIPLVQRHAPHAPLIIVTGYPDLDGAVDALRLGAYDYLLKPISPETLRAGLRRIAERKNAIDQLRHQRDFAERLIETAQAIVLVLDEQGRITRFNSYLAELSGRSLEEVRGKDWFHTFLPAEDHSRIRQVFRHILEEGQLRENVNPIVTADGERRIIRWSAVVVPNEANESQVLSVGHDITDLMEAEKRLIQNERLTAIGQMVTGLAHESRNAFQRSQACLEMLALEVQDQPAAGALIEKIQRALDDLRYLYEEVRDYAAPIVLKRSTFPIDDLCRSTWADVQFARDHQPVRLIERNEASDSRIRADRQAVQQVLRNLLENARDATPPGGEITLKVSPAKIDRRDGLLIQINDEGPGFDPAALRRAFEPFFTTKTRGTGLGLAIALRIVEAHGGTLHVRNRKPSGAQIDLWLPRSLEPA